MKNEKKKKKDAIMNYVKARRKARREVDLKNRLPQEHSKIWKTHTKDIEEKQSNDIKNWEDYLEDYPEYEE